MIDTKTNQQDVDKVDDIISQLKNVPAIVKKAEEMNNVLNKQDVQQFVIEYSSKLIKSAIDSVEYVKDIVQAAPTPDDITALSELIGSTASALEILNKMAINDNKIDNSIKIKQMEIESKQAQLETKVAATTVLLTREEVMKKLLEDSNKIKKAKVIEI